MPPKNQSLRPTPPPSSSIPEVVDPAWLLKAGVGVIFVALAFAYIATCALFYYAQWQLVLKPTHTASHQPADFGLTPEPVSFGADETGQPQIRGWIFPASASAPWVLMLPSGNGSAADSLARAKTFHDGGDNVLLFDYRGVGQSLGKHPGESQMEADSEAALVAVRGKAASAPIIVYGAGAGASLATRLATIHPELAALIVEQPEGDFADTARFDSRAKPVPFRLLFNQEFPLAAPLSTLSRPKLLIMDTTGPAPRVTQGAADPKMILAVPSAGDPAVPAGIRRFLDMYVTRAPDSLLPSGR